MAEPSQYFEFKFSFLGLLLSQIALANTVIGILWGQICPSMTLLQHTIEIKQNIPQYTTLDSFLYSQEIQEC